MSKPGGDTITVGGSPLEGDGPGVRELLAVLDEQRRDEIEREERRSKMAKKIAQYRWQIARTSHRLEDGRSKLDFNSRPFQPAILQDESTDVVLYGAAQGPGKTEILICHAIATAAIAGLKQMWVCANKPKRDKFVQSRINTCFGSVPFYQRLMQVAQERGATSDSTSLKHIGTGSINFVYSDPPSQLTSWPADSIIVDEFQECSHDNMVLLDDRVSGSNWALWWRIGHPTVAGTEENQNLDYLYQNSDRRVWKTPCPFCRAPQELTWDGHCVFVQRNKSGGIVSIRPRDEEWNPSSPLDMRPVCAECNRPMNRLTKNAYWDVTNPGHFRHGYQLSNIPNANRRLSQLFERFKAAQHSSVALTEFYNKQLGKPFDFNTDRLTEAMLRNCTVQDLTQVPPYRFVPASAMDWRGVSESEAA